MLVRAAAASVTAAALVTAGAACDADPAGPGAGAGMRVSAFYPRQLLVVEVPAGAGDSARVLVGGVRPDSIPAGRR